MENQQERREYDKPEEERVCNRVVYHAKARKEKMSARAKMWA
jgi:hypothetical protein